ncbi:MAG: hypothetical protein QNJ36_06735 [Calothrix sp. MO_167.B42]|nr:hypothetical protein [Calothrix sp. MO_167.B42]
MEKRFLALETKFKNLVPPKRRSGWNRILVKLEGCQIRTGSLISGETEELTSLRRLKKRKRQTDWREYFTATGIKRGTADNGYRCFFNTI